ncbi:hypothetical protein PFICI_03726 [Pestalotiopsis fici W106-1]|uniref:Azaphilone pigments biosynthesis cluster protein L N-terminal domain-containing protein n=1 Tax=Pestalotiopsis fici (strain W106-1 / CGMCC3.15140) TaxID=1229662 RepID=W3XKE4_PESFW|nr:uncharacterized protein PFICI_03726 [Pestalotiopsis fici W106-1]ETS85701.1 hypothetical protein PFICI_03726 [Pestalotiopsis fici W106-1]
MADPLSITASIVGITVPALHAVRLLLDDVQKLSDAPNAAQQLRDDLGAVESAITSLQHVNDEDLANLGENIAANIRTTIRICQKTCESFRADLQRWTRHSDAEKLSWRDRTTIGFFKEGQIKSMSQQLQNCKTTINSTVGIAVLYGSIRQGHAIESIQGTLQSKQQEIVQAAGAAERQLAAMDDHTQPNLDHDQTLPQIQSTESTTRAEQRARDDREALRVSAALLKELSIKSEREELVKAAGREKFRATTVTFGNNNSGFQGGIINGSVSGITFGRPA